MNTVHDSPLYIHHKFNIIQHTFLNHCYIFSEAFCHYLHLQFNVVHLISCMHLLTVQSTFYSLIQILQSPLLHSFFSKDELSDSTYITLSYFPVCTNPVPLHLHFFLHKTSCLNHFWIAFTALFGSEIHREKLAY